MLDTTRPEPRTAATTPATLAVSVVIPHYNDLQNLDACLALLMAQSLPREAFEVIVADNMSPCGLAAVEAVAGDRARVVPAPEKGAGPARNAGAAAASAPVLAFLDSDCRPARDWLLRAMEASARATVVGGRVDVFAEDPQRLTGPEAFEAVFGFDNRTYVEQKGFSVSANLIVRREVFDAVGPFRPAVSEDLEWCLRAGRAGHPPVYADDVVVGHPARRTWSELARKWDRLSREGYLLMIEQPGGRLKWAARSLVVLASPLPHSLKVARSPALTSAADRLNAMAVLVRLRLRRFVMAWRLLLAGA